MHETDKALFKADENCPSCHRATREIFRILELLGL